LPVSGCRKNPLAFRGTRAGIFLEKGAPRRTGRRGQSREERAKKSRALWLLSQNLHDSLVRETRSEKREFVADAVRAVRGTLLLRLRHPLFGAPGQFLIVGRHRKHLFLWPGVRYLFRDGAGFPGAVTPVPRIVAGGRHFFGFGKSPRMSRNSRGPFRSLCFRLARSSSVADLSPMRSISWPAIVEAFTAALLPRGFKGCALASPSSISLRMASERVAAFRFAHASMVLIIPGGRRALTRGSLPVGGRPRCFRCTFIDLGMK
jgi:hypothetical protein